MGRKYLLPLIALLIVGMALGASFLAAGSSRPITVSGQAKATAAPDRARVTLGVDADAATARAAQKAAAERMNSVFTAMRGAGLAEHDLKTLSVTLEPIREFDPKNGGERLRGYRASNRIQLTLVDPGTAGAIIDSAVAAGANEVAEIAYYLDDPGALRAKALAAALRDARKRADALANAAGLQIGREHV